MRKQLSPKMKQLVWSAPLANAGCGWDTFSTPVDGRAYELRGRIDPDLPLDDIEAEAKKLL